MRIIQGEMCPWPRTAAMPRIVYHPGFSHPSERAIDVAIWLGLVAIVAALYGVMFVALYHWSVTAPIFQPDSGAAVTQQFHWPD